MRKTAHTQPARQVIELLTVGLDDAWLEIHLNDKPLNINDKHVHGLSIYPIHTGMECSLFSAQERWQGGF